MLADHWLVVELLPQYCQVNKFRNNKMGMSTVYRCNKLAPVGGWIYLSAMEMPYSMLLAHAFELT